MKPFHFAWLIHFVVLVISADDQGIYKLLPEKHSKTRRDIYSGEKPVNSSLAKHKENETNTVTTRTEDNHVYYKSKYYKNGASYFIDLEDATITSKINGLTIKKHQLLSDAYLKGAHCLLEFPFYFYGNRILSVVVTTGGFINVSPVFHAYSHIVHYIAPLMANFNPSMYNSSEILIGSSKDFFVVQWKGMQMNGTVQSDDKKFNFQNILYRNGTIIFAYKSIPISPIQLPNMTHNVTIGVADALLMSYIYMRNGRRYFHNYIYSYHKVILPLTHPRDGSAYMLEPQPNCVQQKNCESCLDPSLKHFQCGWCERLKLCSNGIDWHRQAWLQHCSNKDIKNITQCFPINRLPKENKKENKENKTNVALIVGIILVFLLIIVVIGVFFYYAYTHPQSKSGMWLIEHRPSRLFGRSNIRFDKVQDDQLL